MTTRAPSRPLDELLCSDCRLSVPAFRVENSTDRLCYGCINAAVHRAEAQAAIAEAELVMAQSDQVIRRRLAAFHDEDCEGVA